MLFCNKHLVVYGYIECVDLWLLYWSGPWLARWRPIQPSIIKSLPTPVVNSVMSCQWYITCAIIMM